MIVEHPEVLQRLASVLGPLPQSVATVELVDLPLVPVLLAMLVIALMKMCVLVKVLSLNLAYAQEPTTSSAALSLQSATQELVELVTA